MRKASNPGSSSSRRPPNSQPLAVSEEDQQYYDNLKNLIIDVRRHNIGSVERNRAESALSQYILDVVIPEYGYRTNDFFSNFLRHRFGGDKNYFPTKLLHPKYKKNIDKAINNSVVNSANKQKAKQDEELIRQKYAEAKAYLEKINKDKRNRLQAEVNRTVKYLAEMLEYAELVTSLGGRNPVENGWPEPRREMYKEYKTLVRDYINGSINHNSEVSYRARRLIHEPPPPRPPKRRKQR